MTENLGFPRIVTLFFVFSVLLPRVAVSTPQSEAELFQKATQLAGEKKYLEAVKSLEDYLVKYPQGTLAPTAKTAIGSYLSIAASQLLQAKKYAEAKPIYERLAKEYPDDHGKNAGQQLATIAKLESGGSGTPPKPKEPGKTPAKPTPPPSSSEGVPPSKVGGPPGTGADGDLFSDKLLGAVPKGLVVIGDGLVLSPNGRMIVCTVSNGRANIIVKNGTPIDQYDEITWPAFSPSGHMLAFLARRDGKQFIVIEDRSGMKKGPDFATVECGPYFSGDGSTYAYGASDGAQQFIIVGDQRGEAFDGVGVPQLSHDGKRLAHTASKGMLSDKKVCVVVDGKKSEFFDSVSALPAFSPDGTSVAYVGRRGVQDVLCLNDQKVAQGSIGAFSFSPDGKSIAFTERRGKDSVVVVGNQAGAAFDSAGQPVFSSDGKTVAYTASKGKRCFVVAGDKRGEEFDIVLDPVFSPDGKSVAYAAVVGRKRQVVVVGDKKGPEFERVFDSPRELPVFTSEGTVVYKARTYYASSVGDRWFIVIGDQKGEEYDQIAWPPIISKDGKKVAFGALKGRELWRKVVDVR